MIHENINKAQTQQKQDGHNIVKEKKIFKNLKIFRPYAFFNYLYKTLLTIFSL